MLANTPTTASADFGNGLLTAHLSHYGFFTLNEYRLRSNLGLSFGPRNSSYSNLVVHPAGKLSEGPGFYNPDRIFDSQFHVSPLRPPFTQQDVLNFGLKYPITDDLRKVVQSHQAASGVLSVFSGL